MEVVNSEKRKLTRQALLNATRTLVSEQGHDRVSVQEITHRARVATGTYYNYFDSKQDVFRAVAEDMRDELADGLEPTRSATKDPAMLVSVTLKYYFYQALDNEEWRRFTRAVGLKDMPLQQADDQCAEDIRRGMQAGRFRVDDIHFTQNLIAGMVNHVNREIQRGTIGRNAIEHAIRSILQMLGLPDLVSKALTQTPLPPIAAPRRVRADVTPIAEFQDVQLSS